jgi:hypothetical protein
MVPGAVEPPQLLMPRQWTPLTSKPCRAGVSEFVCPEATRCRPADDRADLNVPAPESCDRTDSGFVMVYKAPRRASGSINWGSVSQGNKIQVSCETSVTKLSTVGRPSGLA